jgi:hypothetical protein
LCLQKTAINNKKEIGSKFHLGLLWFSCFGLEFSFSNVCNSPFFLPIPVWAEGFQHILSFRIRSQGNVHAADVCVNQAICCWAGAGLECLAGVLLVMGLWFCWQVLPLKNGLHLGSCRATFPAFVWLFFLEK